MQNDIWAQRLLVAGMISGLVLAIIGLLRSGESTSPSQTFDLPVGTIALVNGYPIATELYARVLGGFAAERKDRRSDLADRQRVLDRMIDEELLLQRGLELGLARTDQTIRHQIVMALMKSLTAEVADVMPSEQELRQFYVEHHALFTHPGRFAVAQMFFRVPAMTEDERIHLRATEASQRLRAGEPFAVVTQQLGDEPVIRLPSDPLPVEKIQEYLGPTVTQALLRLEPGQVSDPVRSGIGYHVLLLSERQADAVPPFETVREQVLTQYRRMAGEKAVTTYIANLRKRATIRMREDWGVIAEERAPRIED
ncbi:MAG: peptidylprolyl isomerase [Terriglobia bacterium]